MEYTLRSIIVIALVCLIWCVCSYVIGAGIGYRSGYIDALIDMRNNSKPKYILTKQPNGETIWKDVKDE